MTLGPPINPYAPPAADTDNPQLPVPGERAFPHPLFSPKQILAAALVGSLLAGMILLQANYRAMARSSDANKAVLFGLLGTFAVFALGFVLPDNFPGTAISIVVALAFYKFAESLQGDAFKSHRAAGGERQSNWLVFGISVGTLVVVLVIVFLIVRASGGFDSLNAAT